MSKIIKIGFLFPFSTIVPDMSQDIINGFFSAIPEHYRANFQFYPEYIDRGNYELVKVAVNKLVTFHNVDIVSGIISYKVVPEIVSIIEQRKKIAFFFDLGEYLPPLNSYSQLIFFNSMQMWQMEYALGRWAHKNINGKGSVFMSVYEAGYHMHSSFCKGAFTAGAEEMDIHVLPFDPNVRNFETQVKLYLDKISQSKIDYLHVLFCGNEAVDFYKVYKESALYNKIPLIVSPHMASTEILDKIVDAGQKVYTASGWNYGSTSEQNIAFKRSFQLFSGKKASEFGVMGYEMGMMFETLIPYFSKGDQNQIINSLRRNSINGPRGVRNFHHDNTLSPPIIDIEKIITQNNQVVKIVTDQGETLTYNHIVFNDIHSQSVSGWKNPYLCI